jgi:hypothetical protein
MNTEPTQEQATTPRTRAQARAQAFDDLRIADISHGAFRLWHCLYSYANHNTGLCFPGYRRITDDIHCDVHSIDRWITELQAKGWLSRSKVAREKKTDKNGKELKGNQGTGVSNKYTLLNGQGELLCKSPTVGTGQKRSSSKYWAKPQYITGQKRSGVMGKTTVEPITPIKGVNNNITYTAPATHAGSGLDGQPAAGSAGKPAKSKPNFLGGF